MAKGRHDQISEGVPQKERDGVCVIGSLYISPPPCFGTYAANRVKLFYVLLTIANRVCKM